LVVCFFEIFNLEPHDRSRRTEARDSSKLKQRNTVIRDEGLLKGAKKRLAQAEADVANPAKNPNLRQQSCPGESGKPVTS
jgi:hypothetical protein